MSDKNLHYSKIDQKLKDIKCTLAKDEIETDNKIIKLEDDIQSGGCLGLTCTTDPELA